MRILLLAHFAGSPGHGMVYGHYYLAREWVRLGHEVTIAAASFAHTRHRQPECRGLTCEEWIDGIRYLWLRVPAYSPAGRWGRVLNMLAFTARTRVLRAGPFDAVILSSHFPLPIHAAERIARRWGGALVFEVRDLWPLTLIELGGASPRHPFIRYMQRAEARAYRAADLVVSVLPAAKPHMEAHGMDPEKFLFIPNGVDAAVQSAAALLPGEHQERLRELREQGAFLIGYAGRVGLANALHSLVDALCRIDDPHVQVVVLGDGAYRANLKERAQACGVAERLHVLDPVDKVQVAAFLADMDLLYVGLQHQSLFRFGVSPTKLNDYLLAARPILYAIDAPPDVMGESGAGISVPPEDPEAIAEAIAQFRAMTAAQRDAMGRRGREWVIAHRDYGVLARRFLSGIEAVRR